MFFLSFIFFSPSFYCNMSAECSSYYSADGVFVDSFSCPKPGNAAAAIYCCGFNDIKYCCDDANSFFPYEYGYMWWLRQVQFPLSSPFLFFSALKKNKKIMSLLSVDELITNNQYFLHFLCLLFCAIKASLKWHYWTPNLGENQLPLFLLSLEDFSSSIHCIKNSFSFEFCE